MHCPSCLTEMQYTSFIREYRCPKCDYHFSVGTGNETRD